jgi:hypothetical protein
MFEMYSTSNGERGDDDRIITSVMSVSCVYDVWVKASGCVRRICIYFFYLLLTFRPFSLFLPSSKRDDCATSIFCIRARMRRVDSRR